MLVYRNKKNEDKFIIQGRVFKTIEEVRFFLVTEKGITPNAVTAYLDTHLKNIPITKKIAVANIKAFTDMSNKKAGELLTA